MLGMAQGSLDFAGPAAALLKEVAVNKADPRKLRFDFGT